MPIVRMPDGTNVRFPDDMPASQIRSMIASKFPEANRTVMPVEVDMPKGTTTQIEGDVQQFTLPDGTVRTPQREEIPTGESIFPQAQPAATMQEPQEAKPQSGGFFQQQRQRGAELANIINAQRTGGQTIPETAWQMTGHTIGTAADVVGAGIGKGLELGYKALPEGAQQAVSSAGEYISESPVGQKVGELAGEYEANLQRFNEMYPRAGRNLQAMREMSNIIPLSAAPVRKGATVVAKKSGQALKNVGTDVATAPIKGGAAVVKGAAPMTEEARQGLSSAARSKANKYYSAVRESGAEFKPDTVKNLVNKIDTELAARGRLNPALHGKTIAILDDLRKDIQEGILDPARLDENRKLLSRVKKGLEGAEDYGTAQAAVRVINEFEKGLKPSDFTKGSPEVMKQLLAGRAASAKAMKLDRVSDIIKQADGDPNKIKSALTRFVNKEKNLRGFTQAEVKALKDAARNTTSEKLLKMAGKFGIDLGASLTPGNTVAPFVGGYIGGTPIVVAGTVARQLQKYMARGKADDVIRAIQKGKTPKELMKLPPQEARKIIEAVGSE